MRQPLAGWGLTGTGLPALVACLSGAMAAAGLQPFGAWWIALPALAVGLALAAWARAPRVAAWRLWLWAAGYFAVGLRWLLEPFQVEAEIFGWMAPFALALMAGGLALFWAVAGAGAHRLGRGGLSRLWALVVVVSLAELLRAYVLTGFPWAGLAQIWVGTPVAQVLALIGPHGLGMITLLAAALPVMLFATGYRVPGIGVAAALMVGPFLLPATPDAPPPTGHIIRLVQPNAPQHEKWDPEKAGVFFWRQVDATAAAPKPDLIIWPETAIPTLLHQADGALAEVTRAAQGTPVVLGMQRAGGPGDYFNAALVLDAEGQVSQLYDKHHLVPFGEYMPFRDTMLRLGVSGLAAQLGVGYRPGDGPGLFDLGPLGLALPLICYEAVFPQYSRAVDGQRPDFLLQLTNDAWFGTYAGPQQHLAQVQMRAIEQGLPMIRAANTGISAVINARGQVVTSLPLGAQGYIDSALPPALGGTLYARIGDGPVALFLVFTMFLAIFIRWRNH